jgi:2-methylcitrate dehydratase PrpD
MAREGWTASEHAIEGPQGFFAVLGAGKRALEPLATLGAPWKILTTGVAVKPYPSCACTHSIIDGALELRRVQGIRADDVEELTVGVCAGVPRILIHSRPRTGLEASSRPNSRPRPRWPTAGWAWPPSRTTARRIPRSGA